jgi:RNA polymerase sigma-70 factor, ECF subfamily
MADDIPAGPIPGRSPREIFDRYYGRIHRFFMLQRFSHDEASDLTQETLFRVFQHMGELREHDSEEAWVIRIAANVWKNELRFRKAVKRAATEVSLDASMETGPSALEAEAVHHSPRHPDPLEQALTAEGLAAAEACIAQLPPQMRRCLELHAFQHHKYQEIADLLKLSIDSVKSHIHQARQQVRKCVARKHAGGAT